MKWQFYSFCASNINYILFYINSLHALIINVFYINFTDKIYYRCSKQGVSNIGILDQTKHMFPKSPSQDVLTINMSFKTLMHVNVIFDKESNEMFLDNS